MGGINCPPPKINSFSKEKKESYINELADYSSKYFKAVRAFFDSNIIIEDAIVSQGNFSGAKVELLNSKDLLTEAKFKLNKVAGYFYGASDHDINFIEQINRFETIEYLLEEAVDKMDMISSSQGVALQDEIWSKPEITSKLSEIVSELNEASIWQTEFAKDRTFALAF